MPENIIHLNQLEFHVTHKCNLHCDGCAHYNNYSHKGSIPFDIGAEWLKSWGQRVLPSRLKLLGGEPTLNNELGAYVKLCADIWPQTQRILTTNGFFVHRHPNLGGLLAETGTALFVTIHSDDKAYIDKLMPNLKIIGEWRDRLGVPVLFDANLDAWHRTYRGSGSLMKPFSDCNPSVSWEQCHSKFCMQLHENRLWKCGPLAYLRMQAHKVGIQDDPDWIPYLNYDGIGLDCTNEELLEFSLRGPENSCGMCPANPVRYRKDIYKIPVNNSP